MATKKNAASLAKAMASRVPRLNAAQRDTVSELLAEGIHTAFRKASAHPEAHKAWLAIRNLPPEEWGNVVEFVVWGVFGDAEPARKARG